MERSTSILTQEAPPPRSVATDAIATVADVLKLGAGLFLPLHTRLRFAWLALKTAAALNFNAMIFLIAPLSFRQPGSDKDANAYAGLLIQTYLGFWGHLLSALMIASMKELAPAVAAFKKASLNLPTSEARQYPQSSALVANDLATAEAAANIRVVLGATTINALPLLTIVALALGHAETVLCRLHQPQAAAHRAATFMQWYLLGLPLLITATLARMCFIAYKDSAVPALINLLAMVTGTSLAIIWSMGVGENPAQGFAGMALGFVINNLICALGFWWRLTTTPCYRGLQLMRLPSSDELQGMMRRLLPTQLLLVTTRMFEMCSNLILALVAGVFLNQHQQALLASAKVMLFFTVFLGAGGVQTINAKLRVQIKAADATEQWQVVPELWHRITTMVGMLLLPLGFCLIFPEGFRGLLQMPRVSNQEIRRLLPLTWVGAGLQLLRYLLGLVLRAMDRDQTATIVTIAAIALGLTISIMLGTQTSLNLYAFAGGHILPEGMAVLALSRLLLRALPQPMEVATPATTAAHAQVPKGCLRLCGWFARDHSSAHQPSAARRGIEIMPRTDLISSSSSSPAAAAALV